MNKEIEKLWKHVKYHDWRESRRRDRVATASYGHTLTCPLTGLPTRHLYELPANLYMVVGEDVHKAVTYEGKALEDVVASKKNKGLKELLKSCPPWEEE